MKCATWWSPVRALDDREAEAVLPILCAVRVARRPGGFWVAYAVSDQIAARHNCRRTFHLDGDASDAVEAALDAMAAAPCHGGRADLRIARAEQAAA